MSKPIPYDDNDVLPEDDGRDMRQIAVYDEELLKLMPGWTGGQDDPLYAISSSGWNYAWVFEAAIANIDRDLGRVKKLGRNKFQLGNGTFTKAEIDELHTIRDGLQTALEDPESELKPELDEASRVAARHELVGPGTDNIYKYRGASIELSNAGTRRWWATVRFQHQEKDFEATSSDEALEKAKEWIDAAPELREAPLVVADFNMLDDLIAHAGATHLDTDKNRIANKIYVPEGGGYRELRVWQKEGYWHAQSPDNGKLVDRLPSSAAPIINRSPKHGHRTAEAPRRSRLQPGDRVTGGSGRDRDTGQIVSIQGNVAIVFWDSGVQTPIDVSDLHPTKERHSGGSRVDDYEAIDRRDKVIAGPFKTYNDAKDAAGPAGAVRFVPSKPEVRSPRRSAHKKR